METETYTVTLERLPDNTWYAMLEDNSDLLGYGETRYEALQSLVEQLERAFDGEDETP